jgi:16S rRNA (cytosine1402-N4)-methyltransferase
MTNYHVPVLLKESVDGLNIQPGGIYVDVTFGGGGHSREILSRLTTGKLIAFDQDADAKANRMDDPKLIFCQGNFRFLKNFLRFHKIPQINGLLADLGVSSHHFDETERGFTFQGSSPLDMRMNASAKLTAREVLKQYTEAQLRQLFREYGEIDNAHRLASVIVRSRQDAVLETSTDFIEIIKSCVPRGAENKYLAKVYQALRIEVNRELEALKQMLLQCNQMMAPGGRLSVITYHSLEDRIVKNFVKAGNFEGKAEKDFYGNLQAPFKAVNKNVILPSDEEIQQNSRARSAKLRIAEKI